MPRPLWILAAVLLCAHRPAGGEAALERFTSRHYALRTDLGEAFASETLRVLEAAWPQLERYFGHAPPLLRNQRLAFRVYRHRHDWTRFLRRKNVFVRSGWSGVFDGRTASLHLQESARYTRKLVLHEAVHQFHQLACCRKGRPRTTWYSEGLAEYLSGHTWDGETLRLGVVPTLAGQRHATRALEHMAQDASYDVVRALRGLMPVNYAESWALVGFLSETHDKTWRSAWRALRSELDSAKWAVSVLPKLLPHTKDFLPGMKRWLATRREPMKAVWDDWEALDERHVKGRATNVSAAIVREPVDAFECVLAPLEGAGARAGLLLHYGGPQDFTSVHLRGTGGWEIHRCAGEAWTRVQEGLRRFDLTQPLRLRAERAGAHVSFSVDGQRITSVQVPVGTLGLSIHGCEARFSAIRWTPRHHAVSPGPRQR